MNAKDQLLRNCYVEYLRSKMFDRHFDRLHPPPRWRYVLAIPLILSVGAAAIGVGLLASAWRDGRTRKRVRQQLIEEAGRSVPITTFPLIANSALMRQKGAIAPARVIGTFETDATDEEVEELFFKICSTDSKDVSQEAGAVLRTMREGQIHEPGRRIVVPEELTGGRRLYAFDVMVLNDYLLTETLEIPIIHCVAEPGETGSIQMIPQRLIVAVDFIYRNFNKNEH